MKWQFLQNQRRGGAPEGASVHHRSLPQIQQPWLCRWRNSKTPASVPIKSPSFTWIPLLGKNSINHIADFVKFPSCYSALSFFFSKLRFPSIPLFRYMLSSIRVRSLFFFSGICRCFLSITFVILGRDYGANSPNLMSFCSFFAIWC